MHRRTSIFRSVPYYLIVAGICILTGCGSSSTTAPGIEDRSLTGQLQKLTERYNIPGAAGIIVNHSAIIEARAAGIRRAGEDSLVTVDDLFHIGSIGKSMTATMIAVLVDAGVLSWDSKPDDFIPGLPDSIHPGYRDVTLLALLRHRGGTPADEDITSLPTFTGTLPEQRVQGSRWVLKQSPAVPPGIFRYSNAGYVIAAAMAESATNHGWRELMDSLLFRPLAMDACYGWPTECDADQPTGHEPLGSSYRPVEPAVEPPDIRFIEPAGFISMSMIDLAAFMQLHLDARQGNPRLITQAAFDVLHTPVDGYGCGFGIVQGAAGALLWHNGSNGYFYALMYIWPEEDVAAAIAVNAGGRNAELRTQRALDAVLLETID